MKLTKAQRVTLRIATDFGGTIKVYPDQYSVVNMLKAHGLMIDNGMIIDRRASITDAGRRALAEAESK